MIERLQVRGYKSLVDVEVELGPLTVFVGANGSGKTSVLEAIDALRALVSWFPRTLNERTPVHDGFSLSRIVSRQGEEERVEFVVNIRELADRGPLTGILDAEEGRIQLGRGEPVNLTRDAFHFGNPVDPFLRALMHSIRMFRLDTRAMAGPAYSHETDPTLGFDGENLAAVLDALQGEARERFDEIERRLREFVPSLRHLRVKRARTRRNEDDVEVVGHQVSFDFEHAANIRADDASEGTLLLLGLLTVIEANAPNRPLTIMLDDLDRALHPKAQRELVGYLHELIRSRPGLQIIATTHSPYLVEHLEFEEVRAITQAPDGTSVIGSLTDHPEAERWRDEMSAGEFWSSVGESWVAAGRSET